MLREAEEEKFGAGRGGGPGGPHLRGSPSGTGGGRGRAAPARSRPGCLHSWSVFYTRGFGRLPASSRGSGAVSRENLPAHNGREGGRPAPAPPLLRGGEPALRTGPSPRRAGFLDRCPRRGGDARPLPAPPTPAEAALPPFSPQPRRQECAPSRARPPPQLQPWPGPPTSAPAGLPLPRGRRRRRRRRRGSKNPGKLLSSLRLARTHTHISPRGSPPGRGSPVPAPPLMPLRTRKTRRKPLHPPRRCPRALRPASPRAIHAQTTSPRPHLPFTKVCVFPGNLDAQLKAAAPNPPRSPAVLVPTGSQLRVLSQRRRGRRRCSQLSPSLPPAFPDPRSCPAPGV